jgi:hypothetical protein
MFCFLLREHFQLQCIYVIMCLGCCEHEKFQHFWTFHDCLLSLVTMHHITFFLLLMFVQLVLHVQNLIKHGYKDVELHKWWSMVHLWINAQQFDSSLVLNVLYLWSHVRLGAWWLGKGYINHLVLAFFDDIVWWWSLDQTFSCEQTICATIDN